MEHNLYLKGYPMKKLIIGIIIGAVLFGGVSYALRLEEPLKFTDLTNTNELANLNFILSKIQDIVNGRINLDIKTSVPSTGEEGQVFAYSSGGTYRLYIYLNGGFRQWNSD